MSKKSSKNSLHKHLLKEDKELKHGNFPKAPIVSTLDDSRYVTLDSTSRITIPVDEKSNLSTVSWKSELKNKSSPANLSPRSSLKYRGEDAGSKHTKDYENNSNKGYNLSKRNTEHHYRKGFIRGSDDSTSTGYRSGEEGGSELTKDKNYYRKSAGSHEFLKIKSLQNTTNTKDVDNEVASSSIINQNKDYQDSEGNTFLMHAIQKRNLPLVKKLLQLNPNPNLQNKEGNTALILAIETKDQKIINLILNIPAINFDVQNPHEGCALKLAIKYGLKTVEANIVKKILNFRSIPTVLKQAVEHKDPFLVEAMLQRQDSLTDKGRGELGKQEILALRQACQDEQKDIVAILIRFNSPIYFNSLYEIIANNPEIIHLIQIGRLVDKSYALIEEDNKEIELFSETIGKDDYIVFASRLLRKIKEHGLNGYASLEQFYKEYTKKYEPLFKLQEGVKVKDFLDYLKEKFDNPADFITEIKPTEWLSLMDRSGESYKVLQDRIAEKIQELLNFLELSPYEGKAQENLNLLILNDPKTILSIISKQPEIAKKCKEVQKILAQQGLVLAKFDELLTNIVISDAPENPFLSKTVANEITCSLTIPLAYEEQYTNNQPSSTLSGDILNLDNI